MKKLTEKQAARLARVRAKLPEGYTVSLDDSYSDPKYGHRNGPVWAVVVAYHREEVGRVHKATAGFMHAETCCRADHRDAVRNILNRAAAALWHRQPNWGSTS